MIRSNGDAICVTDGTARILAGMGLAAPGEGAPGSGGPVTPDGDAGAVGGAAIPGNGFGFTDAEVEWMASNGAVHVAYDPNWFPLEYRDDSGEIGGISKTYIALFQDATGMEFVTIDAASWEDALAAVRDGRADILPAAARTEERSEYLGFTAPHTTITVDIMTHGKKSLPGRSWQAQGGHGQRLCGRIVA